MTGMTKKKLRRQHERRYRDGLPTDARDWTVEDWADLHRAMQWVMARVRRRHQEKEDSDGNEEQPRKV